MYGIGKKELKESIEHYLEIFGLKEKSQKKVQTFSGGMKRRLNLIAAMLHHPEVLILDEPTAGVDVQSRSMIFEFLSGLKKEGKTIVYSSHYLDEAEKLCTDIAIIDEGKLIASGKTEALLQQHADCKHLEDLFLKLTGKEIRE
jgi:ABC-2 type transport system ATP-binding protein